MKNKLYRNIITGAALLTGLAAGAQQAEATAPVAVAAPEAPSSGMLYLILSACVVMLLAILLLGRILIKLTTMAVAKNKSKTAAVILLLLTGNTLFAQGGAETSTAFTLPYSSDMIMGAVVLFAELAVVLWMLLRINSLLAEISDAPKESFSFKMHLPHLFDNINASVAIEKEKDIMLDHNYDGIRELDNSLPPWWKYSFYISIVWAFIYIGYYYFGGGPSSHDEFVAEMEQAKIEVAEYNRKNALNVDENNVKLADAAGITEGLDIYKTNCAACHGNAGEGGVGPNLTDSYWLHGGSLSDVFKSVKYGWPAKGMKSWQADLSPVQMKNVVSYIQSIHGTNPANAKAPQGELYGEGALAATDSTVIDSSAVAQTDTTAK